MRQVMHSDVGRGGLRWLHRNPKRIDGGGMGGFSLGMSEPGSPTPQELDGLTVTIDRCQRVEESDVPAHRPHKFGYYVTIRNNSLRIVTILSRKWVLTNRKGHRLYIEGDGVVGQFPRLTPGDQFHYNSYHLVDSTSTAEGAYYGRDEDDTPVVVRIPPFVMEVPGSE